MHFKIFLVLLMISTNIACKHRAVPSNSKADYDSTTCSHQVLKSSFANASYKDDFINYSKSRNSVFFDFNSNKVKDEGMVRVNRMISELYKVNNIKVLLHGYTDRVGSKSYNYKLSMRRIAAVKKLLINSGAIKENDIIIQGCGFGKFDPLISYDIVDNNPESRRVDMYIVTN